MSTKPRDKNGRFAKGRSGNPVGRPKGSRNRIKLLIGDRLEEAVPNLVEQIIDAAGNGDTSLAFAIVRLTLGSDRQAPLQVDLPPIESPKDLKKAYTALANALRSGEIDAIGVDAVSLMLDRFARSLELTDVENLRREIEELREELCFHRKAKKWAS